MLRTFHNLCLAITAAALTLPAADPFLGTWKLNIAKSTFSPGPAPRSATVVISQDGGWIAQKADRVDAEGKLTTASNRYKRDGKEYPWRGARVLGKITAKKIDDYHSEAVIKGEDGAIITTRTVISKDGKTRTQTTTVVNAKGEKVNSVGVYDRQ